MRLVRKQFKHGKTRTGVRRNMAELCERGRIACVPNFGGWFKIISSAVISAATNPWERTIYYWWSYVLASF
jgi:hypothetical protein